MYIYYDESNGGSIIFLLAKKIKKSTEYIFIRMERGKLIQYMVVHTEAHHIMLVSAIHMYNIKLSAASVLNI